MKLAEDNYRSAVIAHRDEVLRDLRTKTPKQVVALLQQNGWSREWACAIVAGIEKKHNPARLRLRPEENQRQRNKYSTRALINGVIFFLGLLVTIGTLAFSNTIIIIAYGAIIFGGIFLFSSLSKLRDYPDREIPVYKPRIPKAEGHDPENF